MMMRERLGSTDCSHMRHPGIFERIVVETIYHHIEVILASQLA